MTLSPEQFRERLVDYLYGELEGESLREFEASLAESEPFRGELAAHRRTLAAARTVLSRDDQAPPARLRAAVLAAAAAGVSGSAEQTRVRAPAERAEPRASVWSFLRLPWLVPSFGVAAAVTLFVLGREIESPAHPQSELRAPTVEPSVAAPGEAASTEGVRVEQPSQPADTANESQADGVGSRGRLEGRRPTQEKARARPARSRDEAKGYALPPPAWAEQRAKLEAMPGQAPHDAYAESEQTAERETQEPADKAATSSRGAGGAAAMPARTGGGALGGALADRPAAQPAAAAAPASSSRRDEASADDALGSVKKSAPPSTREALIERARDLTARAQWVDARETYRLLLRRYAGDEQAPVWRRALAALDRAEADSGR